MPKLLSDAIKEDMSSIFDALANDEPIPKLEEKDNALQGKEEEEKEGEEKVIEEEEKTSEEVTGKGKPSEGEKKSEGEEEEKPSVEIEAGDLEPNSGWDKATQDDFRNLPENMQEFLLKRHREMQADYTKKTKDIADIKHALEPVQEEIAELGISEGEALRNLIGAHSLLKSKPLLGFQYLMQAYRVPLEELQEKWLDQEAFTQAVKESGRAADTERKLTAAEREQIKRSHDEEVVRIEEFAKDHEHMEKVMPQMKKLLLSRIKSGEKEKPDLQELYDEAIWLNPEVREILIAERENKDTKTGKDVKQAKKASTRVKQAAEKHEKKKELPSTLSGELSANWDALSTPQ